MPVLLSGFRIDPDHPLVAVHKDHFALPRRCFSNTGSGITSTRALARNLPLRLARLPIDRQQMAAFTMIVGNHDKIPDDNRAGRTSLPVKVGSKLMPPDFFAVVIVCDQRSLLL